VSVKDMIHPDLRRNDDSLKRHRHAIDELHFTYLKLGHLLNALVRRASLRPLVDLFTVQYRSGRLIDDRLVRTAFEHGTPARPCVCEEAAALVEEVHHAERSAPRDKRLPVVVDGLRDVHVFLLRTWQQLIELSDEDEPGFRKELIQLQQQEAEIHRELVELGKQLAA
jgi:hypothetical protein